LNGLLLEISPWIEELQMPAFLNQQDDFSKFVQKNEGKGFIKNEVFNRLFFLKFLIIALTENETSILEYKLVKEEMERLAFVGDSMINTAVIINLYFKCQGGLNEKEFDKRKIATIKSTNLEQFAEDYGLQYLTLKSKYQDKNDIRPRKPSIVL
jgi:dsRNA-specific ribonuclease